MSIVPRMADDAKEAGAIVLEQFDPLPSTARADCTACHATQSARSEDNPGGLDNPDAACAKHRKMVTCFVKEPRPGVTLCVVQTEDGPKLPGEEVQLPTWEYNLPAMRRVLETAEERTARIEQAKMRVNDERRQRLREIGVLNRATKGQKAARARADETRRNLPDAG